MTIEEQRNEAIFYYMLKYIEVNQSTQFSDDIETFYQDFLQNRLMLYLQFLRYYQSLMNREQMPSGEYDYGKLPKTIIVFVTDFDLFGKGLYRYTFEHVLNQTLKHFLASRFLYKQAEKIVIYKRHLRISALKIIRLRSEMKA